MFTWIENNTSTFHSHSHCEKSQGVCPVLLWVGDMEGASHDHFSPWDMQWAHGVSGGHSSDHSVPIFPRARVVFAQ